MKAHAPLDARDIYGDTPLHDAARNGKLKVVQALVHAGALVDVSNKDGKTALDLSREHGRVHVAQVSKAHSHLSATAHAFVTKSMFYLCLRSFSKLTASARRRRMAG